VSVNPRGVWLRILPAFGALLASTWIAAAPLDVVSDCADRASPGLSGIKELGSVCPQLADALATLGLDDVLFDGWQQRLNVSGLQDLTRLTRRYQGPKWHAPATATLPVILATLQEEQAPKLKSLWSSFKSWWKEWLAKSDSFLSRWINRWLDDLLTLKTSVTWVKLIMYGLGVLVVLGALVVVLRELAAAGVLRRRPAEGRARSGPAGAGSAVVLEAAQPSGTDSPAELLRLLVKRLLQTGRLKSAAHLTHRELVVRSAFDSEQQRAAFAGVAWTAESILYGPNNPPREQMTAVIEKGRTLLTQLSDPTGAI
jgi:hypothetical protein